MLTQSILVKIGVRKIISLGIVTFGVSCLMKASFSPTANEFDIILITAIQGLGMMMFFCSIYECIVIGLADEDIGICLGHLTFLKILVVLLVPLL